MKSMTTQIERRFEIASSVVGLIDGSFEIGMFMSLCNRARVVPCLWSGTVAESAFFSIVHIASHYSGNLVVLVLVSYLGPKVHRPKAIAVGCIIMSTGAFLSAVPHFIMGR